MNEPISFFTRLANVQINFLTWRKGLLVGTDRFGNRYFKERRKRDGQRERRWVLYNGEPEASKIPPEWSGWLHHTAADPLPEDSAFHKPWQKPYLSNRSGSAEAYRPPGHLLVGGQRAKATGDYEPWVPE
ncbi:MAG: NADH:ubiquinone oxidoreductase subunit NDUFA12 [Azospirillum sp.]|nr:NADH:ubiquinone oxidoreductase subunit NDUFA12 [Azospirillum sp.]